jgi:purine nucleosidase
MVRKVIIDTDPGTDDALALMMALNSKELEVQGLTTVGGNASLAHTTRNALRLLEHVGRSDVPVYRGAARPLRGRFEYAYQVHGPGGLTARLPLPRARPGPIPAQDYIISAARSMPGELTLIALGPLTNVARALRGERRLREWLREIVVMGGAVHVAGNVTPHAEFNIYNDPIAANIVFSSGIPVALVGLDVCNEVYVARDENDWLSGQSRSEKLAGRILANWFASHPERDRYKLYDPLAVAAAIRPELLLYRQASVSVETEDPQRLGKTSATYNGGDVKVASGVQAQEARQLIRSLL